jgi:hypothetical protein
MSMKQGRGSTTHTREDEFHPHDWTQKFSMNWHFLIENKYESIVDKRSINNNWSTIVDSSPQEVSLTSFMKVSGGEDQKFPLPFQKEQKLKIT